MRHGWGVVPVFLVAVTASAPAARAVDGKALFEKQCTRCHGATLAADTPAGRKLKAPALHGEKLVADEVVKTVRENRKHATTSKKVSDADLQAIAAYMAMLGAQ